MARISGNQGMQQWPFWLDVQVMSLALPTRDLCHTRDLFSPPHAWLILSIAMQSAFPSTVYSKASLQVLYVVSKEICIAGGLEGEGQTGAGGDAAQADARDCGLPCPAARLDHQRWLHSLSESLHLLRCKIADKQPHLQHP